MATPTDRSTQPEPVWTAVRVRASGSSIIFAVITILAVVVIRDLASAATQPLGWLAAAAVIALLLAPLVEIQQRWIPRPLAVATTLVAVLAAIGTIGAGLFVEVREQLTQLGDDLPAAAAEIERRSGDDGVLAELQFGSLVQDLVDRTTDRVTPGTSIEGAVGTIPAYVVTIILALFLLAWAGRMFTGLLRQISDDGRREHIGRGLVMTLRLSQRYLVAAIPLAVLIGIAGGALAWIAGLPTPLVLGVVLGSASLVPYVGVLFGGLPVVVLAVALRPATTTVAVVAGLLALQAASTLVHRRLIEPHSMRVGPAAIVVAVVIGAELAGIGGALVAAVAVVVAVGAIEAFRHEVGDADDDGAETAGAASARRAPQTASRSQ